MRDNDSFLPFLYFDCHLIVSLCTFGYDCNQMYNKTSRSVDLTAIKNRNDNDDGVEGFDVVFRFLQYDSSEFTHI